MKRVYSQIQNATSEEITDFLEAVLRRYSEVFPDWEICTVSLQRGEGRNQQIDRIIQFLEKLKDTGIS